MQNGRQCGIWDLGVYLTFIEGVILSAYTNFYNFSTSHDYKRDVELTHGHAVLFDLTVYQTNMTQQFSTESVLIDEEQYEFCRIQLRETFLVDSSKFSEISRWKETKCRMNTYINSLHPIAFSHCEETLTGWRELKLNSGDEIA